MLNPHPPLAAFPAVLLTLIVSAEVASYAFWQQELRRIARVLLCVLAFFAPVTYLSGYWGVDHANGSFQIPESAIAQHQGYAKLFLLTLVPLFIVVSLQSAVVDAEGAARKRRVIRGIYLGLLIVSLLCGFGTSYLGGALVFSHGAGVLIDK